MQTDAGSLGSALEVVRLFNTLELSHKMKVGTYASKSELLQSDATIRFRAWMEKARSQQPKPPHYTLYSILDFESEETLSGWALAIHGSEFRNAYVLTMIPSKNQEDQGSGTSTGKRHVFATDESGIIYEGDLSPIVRLAASYTPLPEALPGLAPITIPRRDRS